MKFQCQFIYCEQPAICTCGLTNVRQTLKYYNHPCCHHLAHSEQLCHKVATFLFNNYITSVHMEVAYLVLSITLIQSYCILYGQIKGHIIHSFMPAICFIETVVGTYRMLKYGTAHLQGNMYTRVAREQLVSSCKSIRNSTCKFLRVLT